MALAQPTKSSLPGQQQARRDRMLASLGEQHGAVVDPVDPPVAAAVIVDPVAAAVNTPAEPSEQVTLSREEFNALQGARDRSNSVAQAAEVARMEAEELKVRLTELQQQRNEHPQATTTPLSGFSEADTQLSAEEQEQFGESEAFVTKIVRREITAALAKFLEPRLSKVEQTATSAVSTVAKANERRFVDRVRESATDVDALVRHANFADFMESPVPATNITYKQALNDAHASENLKNVLAIFDTFRTKYGVVVANKSGYNGAAPSSAAAAPAPTTSGETFKISDRIKMGQDYIKGRISHEELEAFKVKFNKAEAEGRVTA